MRRDKLAYLRRDARVDFLDTAYSLAVDRLVAIFFMAV